MSEVNKSVFKMVEEDEATGEILAIYEVFKHEFQTPTVPNYIKGLGSSPAMLRFYTDMMRSYYANLTLPQSLISMIQFTIARHNNCEYCSALQEVTCRTLGVDEDTLTALSEQLNEVNPERIRAIIQFAIKVAESPKMLSPEDYQGLLNIGISVDEMMQILFVAGMGVYSDILADSIKLEVDKDVVELLGK